MNPYEYTVYKMWTDKQKECVVCDCELSEKYIQEEIKYRREEPDMCRTCEFKEAGRL